MKERTAYILATLGGLGWFLVVVLIFNPPDWLATSAVRSDSTRVHPSHEPATIEGPPIIKLRDMDSVGLDVQTLARIEPHFHVLNAALVTLVELHRAYDTASFKELRERIQQESRFFHQTADLHEERIEGMLSDLDRERFHRYLRDREFAAGLPEDSASHTHVGRGHSTTLPGVVPRRPDQRTQ